MEAPSPAPSAPRLKVHVTQEEIDNAVRGESSHCMIAEAVRVAYPNASYVSVDLQTIRFSDSSRGLRFVYLTPRHAQMALCDFDLGHSPEPFEFQLRGAQVIRSGRRVASRSRTAAQAAAGQESLGKANATNRTSRKRLSKAIGQTAPQIRDGKTPPRAALASGGLVKGPDTKLRGARRTFGLRSLEQAGANLRSG